MERVSCARFEGRHSRLDVTAQLLCVFLQHRNSMHVGGARAVFTSISNQHAAHVNSHPCCPSPHAIIFPLPRPSLYTVPSPCHTCITFQPYPLLTAWLNSCRHLPAPRGPCGALWHQGSGHHLCVQQGGQRGAQRRAGGLALAAGGWWWL